MKIQEITACRICGNTQLETIFDLGEQALASRFPTKEEPDPPRAPLVLVKCDTTHSNDACGLVQLKHNVSQEELYCHQYGYRSGLNKTMTNHLQQLVHEVEARNVLKPGDLVVDIGSNDATLLKCYKLPVRKVGIDPTGAQFKQFYTSDITLISDFFTIQNFKRASFIQKAKIITSIAMFYDLPDPLTFVRDIKEALHPEGMWVFEQSYLPSMLDTTSFDTICHEHLEYYAFKQIEWMMKKVGLRVLDVSFNNCNGGSFRTTVVHEKASFQSNESQLAKIRDDEIRKGIDTLEPHHEFRLKSEKVKVQLKEFLVKQKQVGKKIHIYGASTKGNTLLQYLEIDNSLLVAAAERNTEKYGRRTPATNIPIISEAESREAKPDAFLVLPWHFKEEFLEREKEYLQQGGSFIFPLPQFEVIGALNIDATRPKRALITGITGQIGSYLAELLIEKGYVVHGIVRRTSLVNARERVEKIKGLNLIYADLADAGSLDSVIQEVAPDEIYNLAAQSHVWVSFKMPEYTANINAVGALRICEAARLLKKPVRIYQASTSELYGGIYNYPVNEEVPFYPKSPYGVAKLYAYWIMRNYREAYDMYCANGIVFNTESPRRGENFVTRKITLGIADIVKGRATSIKLGNLNAKRDWGHARDTAEAMYKILQAEKPGDYVIATGVAHSIREFVECAFKHVGITIAWKGTGINEVGYDAVTGQTLVEVDPLYFRPSEVEVLIGDATKARKELFWKPKYTFEALVREMMEHDLVHG